MTTHIFIRSLCNCCEARGNSMMEVLYDVNIPKETTSETIDLIIGSLVGAKDISCHDDELPIQEVGIKKRFPSQSNVVIRLLLEFYLTVVQGATYVLSPL